MFEMLQSWDAGILLWLQQNCRSDFLNAFMVGISRLGDHGLAAIIIGVLLLFFRKTRRAGLTAAISMAVGSIVVNLIIKPLVMRPRPYITVTELQPLLRMDRDPNSFPSGHTQLFFSLAVALLLTLKIKWVNILTMILAILMGVSRMYVGVHYPTDVLVGALIGVLCSFLALWIILQIEKKVPREKLGWLYEKAA